jgi:hypothetical protein
MSEFKQPDIPGPGGISFDIPDDLYHRIRANLEDQGEAGGGFEALDGFDDAARSAIRGFEASVRSLPREHLRVFSRDGVERFRRAGDSSSVGIDLATLAGNVATHNHPGGMPPSLRDLIIGIEGKALEVRVVTASFDYAVRFSDASRGDLVLQWRPVMQAAIAVAREWMRSHPAVSEDEAYARGYHAAFMELARKGVIKYLRTPHV